MAREVGLGPLDAREVELAAAEGEPRAVVLWEGAIAACAVGVSNLVMSFYPSVVVIGGGIGLGPAFFGPLRDQVLRRPEHHPADLTIVPAALGDDAGLAGAAAWATANGPGLSAGLTWLYARAQALPSKGSLASIRFNYLQQNCNTPTPSGWVSR